MKTENLEALLIDRGVGELAPATAELLDEYLASNPAAAAKARELSDMLGLAGEAMRLSCSCELQPFPREAITHERREMRWRGQISQALKLAACVALGLSIGLFSMSPRNVGSIATVSSPRQYIQTISAMPEKKAESASGFWSLARFEARKKVATPIDSTGRYQLRLELPLSLQKLEEKL